MDSATQQRIRTLINFIRNTQEPGSIANDMVGEILSVLQDNDSDIATSANNVNSRISSLAQKYESVNYYGDLSEQTLADGGLTFRVWTQTNPPAGVSDWRIYLATLKAVTEDGETEWVISDNGLYKRFVYCFVNPSNPKQICAVPPGTTWEAFTAEVGGTEHSFKGNESYGTMASGVTHPGVVPHAGKIYYNCTTRRCVVFGGDADVRRLADLLSLAEMRAEMNAVAAPIRADLNALGENVENFAPVFEELQTDVEGLHSSKAEQSDLLSVRASVNSLSNSVVAKSDLAGLHEALSQVTLVKGIVGTFDEIASNGLWYLNPTSASQVMNRGLWNVTGWADEGEVRPTDWKTRVEIPAGGKFIKIENGDDTLYFIKSGLNKITYGDSVPADLSALADRVTAAEGNIETNTGNITELTDAIGGKASASVVSALADRVTAAEGDIASKASADYLLRLGIYPFNGIVELVGNLPDTNGIYYVNQKQLFYSVSDSGASKGVYMNDRYNGNPTTPSVNKTATYSLYGSLYMIESDGVMYKVVDNYAISSLYQTLSSDISKKASKTSVEDLTEVVDGKVRILPFYTAINSLASIHGTPSEGTTLFLLSTGKFVQYIDGSWQDASVESGYNEEEDGELCASTTNLFRRAYTDNDCLFYAEPSKTDDGYPLRTLRRIVYGDEVTSALALKADASVVSALADLVDSQQETIVDLQAQLDTLTGNTVDMEVTYTDDSTETIRLVRVPIPASEEESGTEGEEGGAS